MEYYIDTTHKAGIQDVLNKTFTPCQTEILNLGNTPHTVWMRFSIFSKTENELYLEINAPLLSHLETFEVYGDSAKLLFTGGSDKYFHERPIASENWLFDLQLKDSAKTTIYIKAQSIYPFQIPIAISSKNKFVEHNELNILFWGVYMGIMLFAFIYNLFIYLSVRERSYLYYLLYILFSVAFYAGLEGFGFQFLWPNIPGINPMIPIFVSITNCLIILFTLRFLNISKDQKILFNAGRIFIVIFILLALLNLAGVFVVALALSQLFSLLVCIYFIAAGIISLKRGIHTAKYFLIGWSAFLVLVILFILTLNNVVPSNFFNTHGIFMGHMAEVVLLSFALADRINILKKENEKKQEEIIIQLEENHELQTKVNRELEQKVTERTAEVVAEKIKVEKQKKRSDDLLLNILPEEVAEELKAKGSAEAQFIDEATVLFTDFKEFTQLSEKLTPKELVSEINECFSAFDHIMGKFGVEKIKTIGDSYMAAGGLPITNTTHACDVVNAALEIQKFMLQHKAKRASEGRLFFEVRIGVHSGPVVAGIVGVKKFSYDIWGDTVNTASRMESSGEVGRVNISGATFALVKDKFNCVYRGKIKAKGKGEIDMYFIDDSVNPDK
ncbi:MAG TPA: adenylate/guanylate cyclase domain-containing protein [Panacibacter sp.]|nr:adenylate/guanylate cyclase domain-containing protein [Panacibacter sp.]HNP45285.1 adenylate/guanylate cyclase domain-containing protein [Panacibacter sp.]